MNFKYKKIIISFIFVLLSFFAINIKINAKTVCLYKSSTSSSSIELVNIGKNIDVYRNGFLDDQYNVLFEMSDNGYCPKNIYQIDSDLDLYDSTSNIKESFSTYELKQNNSNKVACGNITDIPARIPSLTSKIITIIQIAIPIILVIMGSLDLFKGITAQKEEEIKKGQQIFIKRLIFAALIFFVVVIVKFLISLVADGAKDNIVDCIDCFISNDC